MRPLWTGAISFGLINIPVKIFSATKDSALDLDMLDERDRSNIKFKRVNEKQEKKYRTNISSAPIFITMITSYLMMKIMKLPMRRKQRRSRS